MKAEIITIGDEILIGQIVDTNSAWIAAQFNLNGIEVFQITSVHDDGQHIKTALRDAEGRVDLVLITGGLGPTSDDITKPALCEYFNTGLEFHEPTFNHIVERFKHRNISMNKLNRNQAMLPEACTILFNRNGSAPGMWFERSQTIFVSLPGVPFEMKEIVTEELLPRLRATGRTRAIFHKTVLTQGLPESLLAEMIHTWETQLPENIKLAYLPSPMAVRLRLSAMGDDEQVLRQLVEEEAKKLKNIIGDYIYGFDEDQLAGAVGNILVSKTLSLSVAESCTGGYISHLITSVPGSSAWYKGSVTSYSNDVKKSLLGVSEETLQHYGAVSEQVALEMAVGVKRLLHTDYAVATTGIAGPDGGSEEKPVGTVWIAVAGLKGTKTVKYIFDNNRERNIIRSGQSALQFLRLFILEEN